MSLFSEDYSARLSALQDAKWKRVLDVQRPYRWNLNRLCHGTVLEIGCGIGRNLKNLGDRAVGVDINPASVGVARSRGHVAFTPEEFLRSTYSQRGTFDTLLMSHVLEHLDYENARELIRTYLPMLGPQGFVVFECPQELGYRSDETHVRWVDESEIQRQCEGSGLRLIRQYSFPFPRLFGKVFVYNQFEAIARVGE